LVWDYSSNSFFRYVEPGYASEKIGRVEIRTGQWTGRHCSKPSQRVLACVPREKIVRGLISGKVVQLEYVCGGALCEESGKGKIKKRWTYP
jgi:hypothetical protein